MLSKDLFFALTRSYEKYEQRLGRGPLFTAIMYYFEEQKKTEPVLVRSVIDTVGTPDLYQAHDEELHFIYLFGHKETDSKNDEWYLTFVNSELVDSGFNQCGINDTSGYRNGGEYVYEA